MFVSMSVRRVCAAFLPALIVPLLVAGCGSSSPVGAATAQIGQADDRATAVDLQTAAASLEQSRTMNGTYAGAQVSVASVILVRADESSYCLEADSRTATYHLAGPGGTVAPGTC
jgi:hypothetical protein